ncbi:hypothetical protein SKAU_G00369560 [Synaphobranchus kaupii]|uniref:Uncharacterized protein n=1 Tax=Synaphobranchus kaupii TaxID=118154 RepID=A0A9Q1EFU0_SYNKA|nr:hypothetical protein SKAU_G00369560 [Synaphobranchus kaupii]
MASADSQSTLSKPRRRQKDACTDRSPVRGAGTRSRSEYESKEGENVTSASRRSPWDPQAGIDNLPLGKRQVMDKFFTPVHNPCHEETKARGHYHYLPHHSHHHQDNEGHGTPGSSNGTVGQGHVHPRGYRTPEHVDHPQDRTRHHSSQHHSRCSDVSPHSRLHDLEPVASCSRSYSFASSSPSWSSEASIDKEAFLLDGRPGPRHSQSWSSIPVEGQGFWDGEEGAHLEGLDGEQPKRQHAHKLHRRHSKSEEGLLHTNGSENVKPLQLDHSPLYKSASLGRNLAFNDYAEILLDSEKPRKAPSTVQLPGKGILKNKQGQAGEMGGVSNVRKAKSLEVLSTRVEMTAGGLKGGRGVVGNSKMEDEDVEKRKEAARQNFVQEKLQFSAFLNEITRQVISPSCLSSLGVTDACGPPSPGQASQKSPRKEQHAEGERQEAEQVHRQQKDRSSTPESVLSSGHSHSSKYSHSSKRHHHHWHSIDGSSQQQHSTSDASTKDPEHCPPPPLPGQDHGGEERHQGGYSLLLTDGTNTSPELSPHAVRRHRSHAHHRPDPLTYPLKHHQPHPEKYQQHLAHRSPSPHSRRPSKTVQPSHEDTHSGVLGQESDSSQNKDTASTSSTSLEHSDKNKQVCYKASATQPKDTVADIEGAQSLQAQNEELLHSLQQAVMRTESMGAELQKTQLELNSVKDSLNRLRENTSSIQQSNKRLEQKLQTTVLSMDTERKSLTQRISEMSLEQAAAQATILSLKTINIPSLLQELLDKHFQSKEAVTEFLLPAVVPTQFKDIVLDQASAPGDGQGHAPVRDGEEYGKNWQLGSEGGQHRATTFQPWNQKQGHRMGPEGDQRGVGDMVSELEGGKETKGCHPSSLQIPHLQLTTPQASPSNTLSIPAGGGHGVMAHRLASPIHVLSVCPEESHPSSRQQQCCQYLNPDMPGPAVVKSTGALLNFASPEGGDKRDPEEDEVLCKLRLQNSKGKVGISRNSLENDASMVTYQSAQRILDDFMYYLQPPEEERERNGSVKGLASGSKEEFLNEDRKDL